MSPRKFQRKLNSRVTKRKRKAPLNVQKVKNSEEYASAAAKKLSNTKNFEVVANSTVHYCIIAFNLIFGGLADILKCKKCNGNVTFAKSCEVGLGFNLKVKCQCSDYSINSCPRNNNVFEINRRVVLVMRLLGIGFQGIKLFCSFMELSSDFGHTSYYSAVGSMHKSAKALFEAVITKAGQEEKTENSKAGYPADELSVPGMVHGPSGFFPP